MCEVGDSELNARFYPDILVPPSHAVIQVLTLTSFARLGILHSDILTVLPLNNPRHNDRTKVYKTRATTHLQHFSLSIYHYNNLNRFSTSLNHA